MARRRLGAALIGGAVALTLGAALAGCAEGPTDALSKLAHLDAGAHPSSELDPPVVEGVDADLVESSLRMLDDDGGTRYWVGVTADERVCFIAEVAGGDSSTGVTSGASSARSSSIDAPQGLDAALAEGPFAPAVTGAEAGTHVECVGAERFGRAGASLELGDPERRVWLHTEYMPVGAGWTELTPSIAVRR
jgi:hypothetical protein